MNLNDILRLYGCINLISISSAVQGNRILSRITDKQIRQLSTGLKIPLFVFKPLWLENDLANSSDIHIILQYFESSFMERKLVFFSKLPLN